MYCATASMSCPSRLATFPTPYACYSFPYVLEGYVAWCCLPSGPIRRLAKLRKNPAATVKWQFFQRLAANRGENSAKLGLANGTRAVAPPHLRRNARSSTALEKHCRQLIHSIALTVNATFTLQPTRAI